MKHKKLYFALLFFLGGALAQNAAAETLLDQTYEVDGERLTQANNAVGTVEVEGILEGYVLVKFKKGITEAVQTAWVQKYAYRLGAADALGVRKLYFPKTENPNTVAEKLRSENQDTLDFVEVDAVVESSALTNDPALAGQWQHNQLNSTAAWDYATGNGVTIAIADTGVDTDHPDLMANLVTGRNLYDNNNDVEDVEGHGTAVAGMAAAVGNNNLQVAGLAYEAKIMPLRISDPAGLSTWLKMYQALVYAADQNIKIISISYVDSSGSNLVRLGAAYMRSKGGLTIFCEGNTGTVVAAENLGDPANSPDIINVGSSSQNGERSSFSTYGPDIDVLAPGDAVVTTGRGGGLVTGSGTSFAAPLVAGLAALIWQINPAFSSQEVEQIIFDSTIDGGTVGWDQYYGWGKINAGAAIALARSLVPGSDLQVPSTPSNFTATIFQNKAVDLAWEASTDNMGVVGYEIWRDQILIGSTTGLNYRDSAPIKDAMHTYAVKAFDALGNRSTVASVNVSVPNTTKISNFVFNDLTVPVAGVINQDNLIINVSVPYGTNLTSLAPTIVHTGNTLSPTSGVVQNFSMPVQYSVTDIFNNQATYTVKVTARSNPFSTTSTSFNSKEVNGGKAKQSKVKVNFRNISEASWYLSSRRPDFTGATWQPIRSGVSISFQKAGTKKYYFKFKTADGVESGVYSKKVTYAPAKKRVISNSPTKVAPGQTLTQRGKRFSSNAEVALYFTAKPLVVKTDKQGNFSVAYKASKQVGKYTWYAVDLKTGKKSKTAAYEIK